SWMPSDDRASRTAFMMVCGAAILPACPVPFTPSRLDMVGAEPLRPPAKFGRSCARGSAKSMNEPLRSWPDSGSNTTCSSRDCPLGGLPDKAAIDERHPIGGRLKQVRGDQPAFLDQICHGHHKGGAPHMHRTRAAMTVAAGQEIRVALVEAERGNRQSQKVGR